MGKALLIGGRGGNEERSPFLQAGLFGRWQSGNQRSGMFVAGVILSASATASLARRLQDVGDLEIAEKIGFAVDGNQDDLLIGAGEGRAILAVLHDCPAELDPLRRALRART